MRTICAIAGREIRSSFVTPLAYVIMAGFVLLSGFFFFTLVEQFNDVLQRAAFMHEESRPNLNEWIVAPFYQTLAVILVFMIPLLTMRLISEERRSGTFELLVTSPLTSSQVVWGKFLGISFVLLVMLTLSFAFPLVLILFADPEVMPIIVGFIGLTLFTLSLASLGLATSAFTKSQTVAGVASMVLLLLIFVMDSQAEKFGGGISAVFRYVAPSMHLEQMTKGVIDLRDVVYFLSLISVGVFVSNRVLDAERWR